MKKVTGIGISVLLVLFSLISCQKAEKGAAPGKTEDILKLLPAEVNAVIFLDMTRVMKAEIVNKSIADSKDYQKYQEFMEKTGIDPQQDLYAIAVGMKDMQNSENAMVVVNLKYEIEKIKAYMMEKAEEEGKTVQEEDYNGVPILFEDSEDMAMAPLDSAHIALGNGPEGVKAIIDVFQKKADNCLSNKAITDLLDKTNKSAMAWGGVAIPPEEKEKMLSGNPMLQGLESMTAMAFYFDYKNANIEAEIKVLSDDASKNKQIADFLNGLKSFGSMAAAEKPEIGELVDKISITSSEDYVKVYANIPEALIQKLSAEEKPEEDIH
ncbi:MAG: DUF3352 domain-containing protein [Candidatus Aminicenantes bacterium]|nr:DUF3352 domain-containing protein [Candidatus Aminicenantes bacterium]